MKGIMFSFVMVFFTITLITLIAVQRSLVTERREQLYLETRINSMNNLHESIIRDIKKALDIITKRAISVAFGYAATVGPLTDADQKLEELILYGTFNGQSQPLMINATFGNWTGKIMEVGTLKGFDVNITCLYLNVKPYDSWNLVVETKLIINITDLQGVASLNRSEDISALVNLEDLEDPLYPLNTNQQISNFIVKTPFEGNFTNMVLSGYGANGYDYGEVVNISSGLAWTVANRDKKILVTNIATFALIPCLSDFKAIVSDGAVSTSVNKPYVNMTTPDATKILSTGMNVLVDGNNGKVWYIDNLITHAENSYYNESKYGPSFLDRLENKSFIQSKYSSQTTKTIGLESFINKYKFLARSVNIDEGRTNIDYLYFNTSVDANSKGVKGLDKLTPSRYFMIDNDIEYNHHIAYNVSQILIP